MSSEERKIEVSIKLGELEARFSGSVNEVLKCIFDFLGKAYPTYELVSKITLAVDLEQLLKSIEKIIAVTPEGLVLLVPRDRLTDRDAVVLHLVRAYIGNKLGKLDDPSLSITELISLTGGKPSAIAGRLSELARDAYVERVGRGEYRITTLGIKFFLDDILPELKSLIGDVKIE
jgi:hypothetical protein